MTVDFYCEKCKVSFTVSVQKAPIRLSQGEDKPKETKPINVTGRCPTCKAIYTKTA